MIKKFLKANLSCIVIILIGLFLTYYRLPYYILAPGGTIDIGNRVTVDKKPSKINGSLNLLYATQYQANIPMYLLSYIIDTLDREKVSDEQVGDETVKEIELRNKYLLDNSINNALYVAYHESNTDLTIKSSKVIVLAASKDNPNKFRVGDVILSIDEKKINNVSDIKNIENPNNEYKFIVERDNQEITINASKDKEGKYGIVLTTNYEYNLPDDIEIKFKKSESGPSGGLMLSLSIYSALNNEDLIKGKKIAGTGTISLDGTVGEIGGVKYKLIGAARNKVDIMLVPEENYDECLNLKEKYKYDIEVVKVHTFTDAINYLRSL